MRCLKFDTESNQKSIYSFTSRTVFPRADGGKATAKKTETTFRDDKKFIIEFPVDSSALASIARHKTNKNLYNFLENISLLIFSDTKGCCAAAQNFFSGVFLQENEEIKTSRRHGALKEEIRVLPARTRRGTSKKTSDM